MEVTVRYNAVSRADAAAAQLRRLQDQKLKSGNSGWIKFWPLHSPSTTAVKVQPLGSWLGTIYVSTGPGGRGGCDGNVNTPWLLFKPAVEVPRLMMHDSDGMVKQVDVPLMTVGSVPQTPYVDA